MMVNFRNLSGIASKAKEAVDRRGGTDALKQDAEQLKGIAKGPGTFSEKAKAAAAALKEGAAGKPGDTAGTPEAPTSATEPTAAGAKAGSPKKAAGKAKADAAAKAGKATAAGKRKPPAEEVGGAK